MSGMGANAWAAAVAPWTMLPDLADSGQKIFTAKDQRKQAQAMARARASELEVARIQRERELAAQAAGNRIDDLIGRLNSEAEQVNRSATAAREAADAAAARAVAADAAARDAEDLAYAAQDLLNRMPAPPYGDIDALRAYEMVVLQAIRELARGRAASSGLSGMGGLGADPLSAWWRRLIDPGRAREHDERREEQLVELVGQEQELAAAGQAQRKQDISSALKVGGVGLAALGAYYLATRR